jgi:uncharacterized protein (TIGR00369 family)
MSSHPPLPRRSAAEQTRLEAALKELLEHRITFNKTLGLKTISLTPGHCSMAFDMRPELVGHDLHGRLHGGVICAALDALGGVALMVAIGEKFAHDTTEQVMHRFMRLGTIDLRTDFLRPGMGKRFVGTALVTRLGGRIGSTQMQLHNDEGVLISTACGSYVVA